MLDIVNGKVRARAWPRKRPGPKSPEQQKRNDLFAQTQRAYKYGAPAVLEFAIEATRGTPMLPRDFWTQMLFQRLGTIEWGGGRTLYPMVARNSVEAGLDTITQTEGETLIKTADGWRGIPAGAGGGIQLLLNLDITTTTPEVVLTNLGDRGAFLVTLWGMTNAVTSRPTIRFSTNGGASWLQTSGDYRIVTSTGGSISADAAYFRNSNVGDFQRWIAMVGPNTDAGYPHVWTPQFPYSWIVPGLTQKFDAMRLAPSSGAWTGGRVIVASIA